MLLTRRSILAAMVVATCSAAAAGDFPDRPIRIVVPYTPGGPTDIQARLIARLLSEQIGVPVIVENRPGSNGVIGTAHVARAPADGYTLTYNVPALFSKVYVNAPPFDVLKEFEPVGAVFQGPQLLAINAQIPANSVAEFVAYAKARPGKLNYGTGTAITTLSMEQLNVAAGLRIAQIPYKGAGPAVAAMAADEVQVTVGSLTGFVPLVQAGKARLLAVLGEHRLVSMPNVPTMKETGYPMTAQFTFGVFAPAGIPRPALEKLRGAMQQVAANPQMQRSILDAGTPLVVPADRFWTIVGEEIAGAAEVAKLVKFVPQ